MAQKRSAPDSDQKQPQVQKAAANESIASTETQPAVPNPPADEKQPAVQNAPAGDGIGSSSIEQREKPPEVRIAAADENMDVYDKRKADREKKLALRQQDKDFHTETAKIEVRLLELQKSNRKLFESLFRRGSYLAAFRPSAIAEWMDEAKDEDQKQILKDFWFYTARFRVWLGWDFKKADFKKPLAFPPHATKYRARLVNGRLQLMQPFAPELTYEDQYEDGNLSVPDPE